MDALERRLIQEVVRRYAGRAVNQKLEVLLEEHGLDIDALLAASGRKRISEGLFMGLAISAALIDMLGILPFVSTFLFLGHTWVVLIILRLMGYRAGLLRRLITFFIFLTLDFIFPFTPAALAHVITFTWLNNRRFEKRKQRMSGALGTDVQEILIERT